MKSLCYDARSEKHQTIISVVIHIQAYAKCDPYAQNVIPVHKIPNTKKLYQLQSLSLSLQTPAIPPAVQLYTDNSDFATVTQLPISTIVWNR